MWGLGGGGDPTSGVMAGKWVMGAFVVTESTEQRSFMFLEARVITTEADW